jgi:phosphohistidine phosphatase
MKNAQFMAERFMDEGPEIDLLLSSTANRAQSTMRYYQDQLAIPDTMVSLERKIYGAGVRDMMQILENIDDKHDTVMIFGHNPTFSDLSSYLDANFNDYLVTCARVKVELDIDSWKEIHSNCGKVKEHVFPKQFPEMRE